MSRYIADLETDGLLEQVTKVHCCVAKDIETGEVHKFGPGDTGQMLDLLGKAELLIFHNGCKFDLPVLKKLYGFEFKGLLRDTLIMSRLIWPNLMELDAKARIKDFPKQLTGRHSLEAWGYRLGCLKGDFGKDTDWKEYSQAMMDYCVQDVCGTTAALWEKIQSKNYSLEAIENEHDFAFVMCQMENAGFTFDEKKAHQLHARLGQRRLELEKELQEICQGWWEDMKVPEYWVVPDEREGPFAPGAVVIRCGATKAEAVKFLKAKGWKGKDINAKLVPGPLKKKHTPFNPGSRDHIARYFMEMYGWKPRIFTDGGKPQIDESSLEQMTFPEAKLLLEYFMLEKRLGALAEGDNAWLKLVKPDGRIHGQVNPMGTVTSRCSHNKPNMGQVVAVDKPYGKECRGLFTARPGQVLVGADASGIQLRALAHYLHRWDGGKYVELVTKGDVHTANQLAAGFPTRDMAKTFVYAWALGAGDRKIGEIVGKGAAEGKALKDRFLKALPAFRHLKERIAERVNQTQSITGLDGRIMPVGSAHLALGSLLQGFEAVVMKKAAWFLYQTLTEKGYKHETDFSFVAMVHDEFQLSANKEIADEVGRTAVESIKKAGEYFKSLCPLDGAYKVGADWAGTH